MDTHNCHSSLLHTYSDMLSSPSDQDTSSRMAPNITQTEQPRRNYTKCFNYILWGCLKELQMPNTACDVG